MPIINLSTLQDILGGTEPVNASVTAYVYRGAHRAIRLAGEEIIFPAPVSVEIVDGVPLENLVLASIPADCYWKIIVWTDQKSPLRKNVVLPGGVGPFDFDELIDVDPSTGLPDAGTNLADAYVMQVEQASQIASHTYTRVLVSTADTLVGDISHSGKLLYFSIDGENGAYTIPSNESVPFAIGTEIKFATDGTTSLYIDRSDTELTTLIGEGSNGYWGENWTFILPANSTATLLKVENERWILSGLRLTD